MEEGISLISQRHLSRFGGILELCCMPISTPYASQVGAAAAAQNIH
jgi:hypothetical protein